MKITLLTVGITGLLAGCSSTRPNSLFNSLTGPFQPSANQPRVPEVKVDFALPNDFRNEPIKVKSLGVTENCDLTGTCNNTPPH